MFSYIRPKLIGGRLCGRIALRVLPARLSIRKPHFPFHWYRTTIRSRYPPEGCICDLIETIELCEIVILPQSDPAMEILTESNIIDQSVSESILTRRNHQIVICEPRALMWETSVQLSDKYFAIPKLQFQWWRFDPTHHLHCQ